MVLMKDSEVKALDTQEDFFFFQLKCHKNVGRFPLSLCAWHLALAKNKLLSSLRSQAPHKSQI